MGVKREVQCDGKVTASHTCFSGHMKMRYRYRMLCTIVNAGRLLAKRVGTLALIVLMCSRTFLYHLSGSDYEKQWGKDYAKPGIGTRIVSTLFRYMPRIGPFKGSGFNNSTPQTEDLYIKSINATVDQYRVFLAEVRTNSLTLANCDFDTGEPTKAAKYSLTDETYTKLLAQLADRKFDRTSPDLRANILEFYFDLSVAIETKKDNVRWQCVLKSLDQLKAAAPGAIVADNLASRPELIPTAEVARTPTVILDRVSHLIGPAK